MYHGPGLDVTDPIHYENDNIYAKVQKEIGNKFAQA